MITNMLLSLVLMVHVSTAVYAGPIHSPDEGGKDITQVIHRAGHAVDHAWEAFHHAALGGTLASPALQMKIERELGEARRLLVDAREAAEQGDREKVRSLASTIEQIATQIIEDSQRRKP